MRDCGTAVVVPRYLIDQVELAADTKGRLLAGYRCERGLRERLHHPRLLHRVEEAIEGSAGVPIAHTARRLLNSERSHCVCEQRPADAVGLPRDQIDVQL